jgi:hypothetical protein
LDTKALLSEFQAIASENELLRESYANMAKAILDLEDEGWKPLTIFEQNEGFALQELKQAAKKIREMVEGNPLLKRGCAMRTSYIFGRGVNFNEQPPRIRNIIMSPQNQDVIFSAEAQQINERSHFTDGQFFLLADVQSKQFQRIPFDEITGVVTDPDDSEQIRYFRRSWASYNQESSNTPTAVQREVWYPTDTYSPARYPRSIQGQPVDASKRMFASRVNRRAGRIWGVPDALPAVAWAHAYSEYLKDGSRLLKSLAMFAWSVKTKTRAGQAAAAASIATPSTVGSTAVMGDGMELSSLPRSNNVDLSTGRPLASMVASALEISVVALLSDPGSSGAYGTAQTLDVPTVKAMESRQETWSLFYQRVMNFINAREFEINWPKIETEPSQRMMQALALARETNAIWDDEYRAAVIEVLDIPKMHNEGPEGAEMYGGMSAIPSQGNSGGVGSMQDQANDLRDADNNPVA